MDDAFCLRALQAISVHVAHNVVTHFLFTLLCVLVVDVVLVCLELLDHLRGDLGQAQLHLGLSQCDPQASPGTEFHIR